MTMTDTRSELDMLVAMGSLGMLLVDPNSRMGLTYEGFVARQRDHKREDNPFSTLRFKGCLAEGYWSEGWDACDERLANIPARSGNK